MRVVSKADSYRHPTAISILRVFECANRSAARTHSYSTIRSIELVTKHAREDLIKDKVEDSMQTNRKIIQVKLSVIVARALLDW